MQQTESQHQQQDILIMRHARSGFNQKEVQFLKNNPHLKYPEAEENELFRRQVLFSEKYIDSHLCLTGINQCFKSRSSRALNAVELVLVSPFNRALQTAHLIFKNKNIPFIVHPLLAESIRYSCDLMHPLRPKIMQFPSFDFTLMQDLAHNDYIENNLGLKNREVLKKLHRKFPNHTSMEHREAICSLINTRELYQTNQELRIRTDQFLKNLIEYRKKYNKIAVISHQWVLSFIICQKFDEYSNPLGVPELMNATPYWFSLVKLLKK